MLCKRLLAAAAAAGGEAEQHVWGCENMGVGV
jgi:hypothetical protein